MQRDITGDNWSSRFFVIAIAGISFFLLFKVFGLLGVILGALSIPFIWRQKKAPIELPEPLSYSQAPWLFQQITQLAGRAGLKQTPILYFNSSGIPNAFTVKNEKGPGIVLTHGLISLLNQEELIGVVAHEISHIANKDHFLLKVTALFTGITKSIKQTAWLLLFIQIPFLLYFPLRGWFFIPVVLVGIPLIQRLMQFALMRRRELAADRKAAFLTGNPMALVHALEKIEALSGKSKDSRATATGNPLLDTHPPLADRITRLKASGAGVSPLWFAQID